MNTRTHRKEYFSSVALLALMLGGIYPAHAQTDNSMVEAAQEGEAAVPTMGENQPALADPAASEDAEYEEEAIIITG